MRKAPLTASPPKPSCNGASSELCSCALTHFPPPLKGRRSDQLLGPQEPLDFTPPRSDPEKLASASSPTHPPKKFERMRTSHPVEQDERSSERWLFRGRQALAPPVSEAD